MTKVGGEVDAWCTKCRMMLAHTVIAMVGPKPVKVKCNTCEGVHAFKGPPDGTADTATPGKKRAPREKPVIISFDEVLRTKNLALASKYSPKATYAQDQVIEHPSFGLGFVAEVKDGGKILVTFRTDAKVLIHGRT